MAALMVMAGLVLAGCENPTGGGNNQGDETGRISGTITLTDIPAGASVYIRASFENWSPSDVEIDLSGVSGTGGTDIPWTIPLDEENREIWSGITGTQTAWFFLYVVMEGSDGGYNFEIRLDSTELDMTAKSNIQAGSLGRVSLASLKLSGTISINDGGDPVPRVYIEASSQESYLNRVSLESPAAGAPWSIHIPVQQGGAVRFRVYSYDSSGNRLFDKTLEPAATVSVTSGDISGITLDIGDISQGRMRGTVSFTNMPSPAPYRVYLDARYQDAGNSWRSIGGGYSSTVTVSGNAGTWTIPRDDQFLDYLGDSSLPVTFLLYMYAKEGENDFMVAEVEKTVNKAALAAVDLGTVSLACVTLSGTITVNDGGSPVPEVFIAVYIQKNSQEYHVSSIFLESPAADAPWSLTMPAQQGGKVIFRMEGYDSSSDRKLFYKTLEPAATASVSTQSISGIALNIGDISQGRMNGTVRFTNVPSPAPYGIHLSAEYQDAGNSWQYIGGDSSSTITVSGAAWTWTIPQDEQFLDYLGSGSLPVTFRLSMQAKESENSFMVAEVEQTVNKAALAALDLGTVSLACVTLSGTISVNDGGSPVPRVSISANIQKNSQESYLNSVSLESPAANAPWSMTIPAQQGEKVTFLVSGSGSSGNGLFSKTLEPAATASVSTQSISGIALNIGDIGF
jgi:hypothetical protein